MKRILLSLCLIVCAIVAKAQPSMPLIMVIPSDSYCYQHGYMVEQKIADRVQRTPEYDRFVTEDKELLFMINTFSNLLVERGFKLNDLAHAIETLKAKETESGETSDQSLYKRLIESSGTSIVVTLDYKIDSQLGPRKSYAFFIKAVEANTGKVVTSENRVSFPTINALQDVFKNEAYGYIDVFTRELMDYFITLVK